VQPGKLDESDHSIILALIYSCPVNEIACIDQECSRADWMWQNIPSRLTGAQADKAVSVPFSARTANSRVESRVTLTAVCLSVGPLV
jgi:hypothetical protein